MKSLEPEPFIELCRTLVFGVDECCENGDRRPEAAPKCVNQHCGPQARALMSSVNCQTAYSHDRNIWITGQFLDNVLRKFRQQNAAG